MTDETSTPIQTSPNKPPIYEKLRLRFGVDWDKGLIIAWEGVIYSTFKPTAAKIVHESIHLKEQARLGNEAWWMLYFDDPAFRLNQEKMAYRAEAQFIKRNIKNRDHAFHMIREIADALSSSVYGCIISRQEAFDFLNS